MQRKTSTSDKLETDIKRRSARKKEEGHKIYVLAAQLGGPNRREAFGRGGRYRGKKEDKAQVGVRGGNAPGREKLRKSTSQGVTDARG